MPAVTVLGQLDTGHGSWPPRGNNKASTNVFVNGIGVHRSTDTYPIHCNTDPECHPATLSSGSGTVKINGLDCARIGDPVSCGGTIAEGSSNVFAGG